MFGLRDWIGAILLAGVLAGPGTAQGGGSRLPEAGEPRQFRDWVAACDTFRRCTAIGLGAEDGAGGYVVLQRGGGADAAPRVRLNAYLPDPAAGESEGLHAEVRGGTEALLSEAYPAEVQGDFLTAAVTGPEAEALVAALRDGLDLDLTIDGAAAEPQRISLRGSTAALDHIDELQGRLGTVTALARPGDGPAAAVPPVPQAVPIARLVMKALDAPLPALPEGLAAADDPNCAGVSPLAIAMPDGGRLWGLCEVAGPYNTGYRFWIAKGDRVAPALFGLPRPDAAVLTNPSLTADGLVIDATERGRGVGDCGTRTEWAWTGERFALLQRRAMPLCRGVPQNDWPVVFRADT